MFRVPALLRIDAVACRWASINGRGGGFDSSCERLLEKNSHIKDDGAFVWESVSFYIFALLPIKNI